MFAESVRAVFFLPPVAVAVPPLVAVAVHRLHLVASAVLPAPRATARECSPGVVIATVVSLGSVSRTVTPLTDLVTGTFGFFFADGAVDVVDAESVDEDVVDAESVDEDVSGFDGLADATNGIANIPAPIPRATANAPIRPIYLACPMFVYLALLIFGLPSCQLR